MHYVSNSSAKFIVLYKYKIEWIKKNWYKFFKTSKLIGRWTNTQVKENVIVYFKVTGIFQIIPSKIVITGAIRLFKRRQKMKL